jgi:hypothetical protein
MRSITLIARSAGLTQVITMRPDGHLSGGLGEGPVTRYRKERDLAPEALAEVFKLAALVETPSSPRGGGADSITITLQTEDARRRHYVWPFGSRPSDARLAELLGAIEALRDRELKPD